MRLAPITKSFLSIRHSFTPRWEETFFSSFIWASLAIYAVFCFCFFLLFFFWECVFMIFFLMWFILNVFYLSLCFVGLDWRACIGRTGQAEVPLMRWWPSAIHRYTCVSFCVCMRVYVKLKFLSCVVIYARVTICTHCACVFRYVIWMHIVWVRGMLVFLPSIIIHLFSLRLDEWFIANIIPDLTN